MLGPAQDFLSGRVLADLRRPERRRVQVLDDPRAALGDSG